MQRSIEPKTKNYFRKKIQYSLCIFFMGCLGLILNSCKDDDLTTSPQPGFIVKIPETLTEEAGAIFELTVPQKDGVDSFLWTIPESLEIIEGQGTERITVKTWSKGGLIPERSISVISKNAYGESRPRIYFKEISILLPPPSLDDYTTKRYGAKTWMTQNLNEKGSDNNLGRYYNDDEAMAIYGRLYTWDEAVTGISKCTPAQNPVKWGSTGIDAAGNPYIIDGSPANSYNIQLQGACPDGWHLPNAYDWYDLFVAIKENYNIPGTSIADVANTMEGYVVAWGRNDGFATSAQGGNGLNLTNWGFVGAYLKGSSSKVADGGLWDGGSIFSYGGNTVFPNSASYPLYLPERENIAFNILPGGQWTGSAYSNESKYSYHWSAYVPFENKPWRFTIGSANVNISNGASASTYGYNVRCVANY